MSVLQTVEDIFVKLIVGLGTLVGMIIGLIAIAIAFDVVNRNLGWGSLYWLNEVSEYALYFCGFAAAPWALHLGAHVRIDILVTSLPQKMGVILEQAVDLIGAIICLIIAYYSALGTIDSFQMGTLKYKAFATPEWMLFAVVPVAMLLMAMEFFFRIFRAREIIAGSDEKAGF